MSWQIITIKRVTKSLISHSFHIDRLTPEDAWKQNNYNVSNNNSMMTDQPHYRLFCLVIFYFYSLLTLFLFIILQFFQYTKTATERRYNMRKQKIWPHYSHKLEGSINWILLCCRFKLKYLCSSYLAGVTWVEETHTVIKYFDAFIV